MARILKTRNGRSVRATVGVLGCRLRIPFRVRAVEAMPAGSPVTWFQPFARGDIPAGWRVTLVTAAGAVVPVQQDQEVTWPDGSTRGAALSFQMPTALAAGETASFAISRALGAPNRTGYATLAAVMAASDLRLSLFGLDLGADAMEMRFNEVAASFPQATSAASWGLNPIGGWEVIRSGPLCVEWLAWRYTRRASDGAHHRWQKAQLYVRQWAGGAREITPVLSQPNAHSAHPTGTVGPTYQTRIACYAELYDGATRLHAWGGPNDARAFTVAASAFDATVNELVLPAPAYVSWGYGSAIGLAGALPSGLSASEAYHPYETGGGTRTGLTTRRAHAVRGERGTAAVFGTAAATGNVTIMPASSTYPSCAAVLMTEAGYPVWQGVSPRPSLLAAHDEVYLTRRTRAVPPYDLTVLRPAPAANAGFDRFMVGTMTGQMKGPDDTGDDVGSNRVGYLPVTHCASLLVPFDGPRERATRVMALQYAGYTLWCDDHRSGRPVAATNGRDRAGAQYPGLGPCNQDFRMYLKGNGGVNTGSPPWGGYEGWYHDGNSPGHPGYFPSYNVPADGSHLPDFTTVPYLKTGHHVYAMIALATACAVLYGFANRRRTIGARTYHGVMLNSGRTMGWATRAIGNAEALVPDAHPSRAVLRDGFDDHVEYFRDYMSTAPSRFIGVHFDIFNIGSWPWMQAMHATCIGMEVWRNTRSAWRTLYESMAIYQVDGFDDLGSSPGAGYLVNAGTDDFTPRDGSGTVWTSIAAMNSQYGAAPFPMAGLFKQGENTPENQNSYPAMHAAALALMQTNHALGLVSIPDAGRVRRQQLKRRTRSPLAIKPYADAEAGAGIYVTWAIVPVGV